MWPPLTSMQFCVVFWRIWAVEECRRLVGITTNTRSYVDSRRKNLVAKLNMIAGFGSFIPIISSLRNWKSWNQASRKCRIARWKPEEQTLRVTTFAGLYFLGIQTILELSVINHHPIKYGIHTRRNTLIVLLCRPGAICISIITNVMTTTAAIAVMEVATTIAWATAVILALVDPSRQFFFWLFLFVFVLMEWSQWIPLTSSYSRRDGCGGRWFYVIGTILAFWSYTR